MIRVNHKTSIEELARKITSNINAVTNNKTTNAVLPHMQQIVPLSNGYWLFYNLLMSCLSCTHMGDAKSICLIDRILDVRDITTVVTAIKRNCLDRIYQLIEVKIIVRIFMYYTTNKFWYFRSNMIYDSNVQTLTTESRSHCIYSTWYYKVRITITSQTRLLEEEFHFEFPVVIGCLLWVLNTFVWVLKLCFNASMYQAYHLSWLAF